MSGKTVSNALKTESQTVIKRHIGYGLSLGLKATMTNNHNLRHPITIKHKNQKCISPIEFQNIQGGRGKQFTQQPISSFLKENICKLRNSSGKKRSLYSDIMKIRDVAFKFCVWYEGGFQILLYSGYPVISVPFAEWSWYPC